ncbi:MAG: F510_1955 family glycosylhydrolase [Candidatus Saccharimonadales bacterium]
MKKVVIGIGVVVAVLFAVWLFSAPSENTSNPNKAETVSGLKDAHGLAVDRKNSSKVYIATHTGLLVMNNDGSELQRVGTAKDDYMGFSAHPSDPNIFYSSGHPSTGGNIGFQKSNDGGSTWQKIADGIGGPVDFHTMAVSQAEPSIVYGVYRGQLQRSNNEGKDWQLVQSSLANPIVLATSPTSKDTLYAGTTEGLMISQNQGADWSKLSLNKAVVALVVNPKNEQQIVAYSEDQGLVLSNDGGKSWNKLDNYTGSIVMHLAYDVQNPSVIYLINQSLEIYKTTDGGNVWTKVR